MTIIRPLHRFPLFACSFCLLALAALLLTAGCDSNGPPEDEIVDVRVIPDHATLTVGESIDFSVVAVKASGEEIPIPATGETSWYSIDPSVFALQSNGTGIAHQQGNAICVFKWERDIANESSNSRPAVRSMLVPILVDSFGVAVSPQLNLKTSSPITTQPPEENP